MSTTTQGPIAGHPARVWGLFGVVAALTGFIFWDGMAELVRLWQKQEEYSHGYLIPVISAYLIWQKRCQLARIGFPGAWTGTAVVLLGLMAFVLGDLATVYVVIHYALILVLAGIALSLFGWRGFVIVVVPILFLLFMVPLPPFLHNTLSAELQLISSELGVQVIRAFGISVLLEGNVIDLGTYQLQVADACSGLRYLFPLMSFAFLSAYLFRDAVWKRGLIFFSSIPISVLMNSIRIGVIGVLVDRYGIEQAEGFLHYFEGWAVFMICVAILLGEMGLLVRLGAEKKRVGDVFAIGSPALNHQSAPGLTPPSGLPMPYVAVGILLLATAVGAGILEKRHDMIPERAHLSEFPAELEGWVGRRNRIREVYLDALSLTDYILADYREPGGGTVNLYVAYYASQRKNESAHSPRSCLPGDGWEIKDLSQKSIDGVLLNGQALALNRVKIQKGDYRQLVYYWFQQRGRILTNEYRVKWYLFWDALTRQRTDGALVRLTTHVAPGETWGLADQRLHRFLKTAAGRLDRFIPQ